MDSIAIASFLSMFTNRVIEAIAQPIKAKYPTLDMWWLLYVSWIIGGLVGWLSGVNLFVDYMPNELVARLMTSVVIGGGANLLNDLFSGEKAYQLPEFYEESLP